MTSLPQVLLTLAFLMNRCRTQSPPVVRHDAYDHRVIVIREGETAQLQCPVDHSFERNYFDWYKDSEPLNTDYGRLSISDSTGSLRITEASVQDSGHYTCKAINGFGSVDVNVTLIVRGTEPIESSRDNHHPGSVDRGHSSRARGKPEHMSLHPENTTVMAGETVAFQCIVRSEAKPTMKWLKQVPESEVHHQEQTVIRLGEEIFRMLSSTETVAQSEGLFTNRLVIARTRDSDAGRYVCWAGNIDDFNFLSAHLSIIPTPSISTTPVIIIISLVALFLLLTIVVSICLCRHCRAEEERSSTAPQVPDKVECHTQLLVGGPHGRHLQKTTSSTAYSPPPPPALPPLLAAANCKLLPPHPATMMSNQQWRFSHTPSANGSRHYHTQRHLHYVC
ncbi:fibroblast growth factor receptor-like 1 isoform X3 [Ornithodoros turicata]|uniref:fibroblast growth factor receptor-like 1 isoform X3 n=1 Tax=Ornithodoros turicata TaxID=34597 RepID=UPI0031388903